MNIKDKLAAARLPERVHRLCLRGDLDQLLRDLQAQLKEAHRRGATSMAGAEIGDLPERIAATEAEMAEHTIELRFRALPKRRWSELLAAHPARPEEPQELMLGYAPGPFYSAAIPESAVDCELDAADWRTLIGDATIDGLLTDGQWDELTQVVYELNRKPSPVPFSVTASSPMTGSGSE